MTFLLPWKILMACLHETKEWNFRNLNPKQKRQRWKKSWSLVPFQGMHQTTGYFLLPRTVELPVSVLFKLGFLIFSRVQWVKASPEKCSHLHPPPPPHPHPQPQPPVPGSLLNLNLALRLVGCFALGHCLYGCTPPHPTHYTVNFSRVGMGLIHVGASRA